LPFAACNGVISALPAVINSPAHMIYDSSADKKRKEKEKSQAKESFSSPPILILTLSSQAPKHKHPNAQR
jgi:hypothetical protein